MHSLRRRALCIARRYSLSHVKNKFAICLSYCRNRNFKNVYECRDATVLMHTNHFVGYFPAKSGLASSLLILKVWSVLVGQARGTIPPGLLQASRLSTGFVQTLESPESKMLRFLGLESPGKRHRSWKTLEKSCNSKVVVLKILLSGSSIAA